MKISIDTDHDTLEDAVAAIYAAYGRADHDAGDMKEDDGYLPGNWNRPRLAKLVEWLGDADAAVALRYIAANAPAVELDEVFQHMADHTGITDFSGKHISGRMSAIGFGRNHIGGNVGPVYETDYSSRKYRMDKGLAEALLEEMDAYGQS